MRQGAEKRCEPVGTAVRRADYPRAGSEQAPEHLFGSLTTAFSPRQQKYDDVSNTAAWRPRSLRDDPGHPGKPHVEAARGRAAAGRASASPRGKTRWTRGGRGVQWLGPGAVARCAKRKRRRNSTSTSPGSAMAIRAGPSVRAVGVALLFFLAAAPAAVQPESGTPQPTGTDGAAGVGLFVPRRWGTVGVTVSNPADRPAEVLSAHSFGD